MKLEDLENYRDENGFIDMDLAINENKLEIGNELRGSQNRDKFWVFLDDTEVLVRSENLDECAKDYTIYAELLVEELAKQVGIDCAHYDAMKYNGKSGVISKNVLDKKKDEGMFDFRSISSKKLVPNDLVDIVDIFSAIENLAKTEDISKDLAKKAYFDVAKIAIFDTFTMSNDRHSENIAIIFGKDQKNGEPIFKVAPIFDNECSLMLDLPEEEIDEISNGKIDLKNMVDLQEQMITAPEEVKCGDEDWKEMLYYLTDDSEELEEFSERCYNDLSIEDAITSVEGRINTNLPDKLKDFVTKAFNTRKRSIGKSLMLDDMEVER